MAASIEGDGLLVGNLSGNVVVLESLDLRFQCCIQVGNVGLMMFGVL